MSAPDPETNPRLIPTDAIANRDRYQLLTSLVVPRPIGWVSSRSAAGARNLAPFSYFVALATTPLLVGLSVGSRRGSPKDTLTNIRETGAFCVNVVTERHLHAMNESAGEHPPDVDEFDVAGVRAAEAKLVSAPYVADCPAVFECRLHREVELGDPSAVFIIGEVLGVRLDASLAFLPGTHYVDPEALRPVARLGGDLYAFLGEISRLPRPQTS
jgi:flavin reductase (DIM6/NTAB) family NADH-FMN oxidoreductase RutF